MSGFNALFTLLAGAHIWVYLVGAVPAGRTEASSSFGSADSARENGFRIFNAVHSAMRQWGSSLDHNGMSLFLATVPESISLFHGSHSKDSVIGTEWLAFEIEHAEEFAFASFDPARSGMSFAGSSQQPQLRPNEGLGADDGTTGLGPGLLHTYRTTRPQTFLLFDGMSAGKVEWGLLDTQDILLRNKSTSGSLRDEWSRALDLCKLATAWGIDGVLRLEAGFEAIKCNFTDGMEFLGASRQPRRYRGHSTTAGADDIQSSRASSMNYMHRFQYLRAAAQRYWDIGGSSVIVDFGSMVSAYFHPLILTNPNHKYAEHPRLINLSPQELDLIRDHLEAVLARPRVNKGRFREAASSPRPNWQDVTDMIVARYSERLRFLASDTVAEDLEDEISRTVDTFIDYSRAQPDEERALERCIHQYQFMVTVDTREDELIQIALDTVTEAICQTFFGFKESLLSQGNDHDPRWAARVHHTIQELMNRLNWPEWKHCGLCAPDELCLVAMWPFGDVEDHYSPRCLHKTEILGRRTYWSE